ncbi:barstar family protein [Streptomyces sp. NPDC006296]|uniref:barstar family protein n=1 Tax=Streptomyces sp. NPDC006296 TaxID=3156746 RepID=UPI0033A14475
MTVTYVIDGSGITGLDGFWAAMGEAVNGPGGYFGRNLDSFADCLRGGFGTPADGSFVIEWRDHARSARALGHEETARRLEGLLTRAHPTHRAHVERELAEARAGRGPTLFDVLVGIIREEAGPEALRLA